jgi:hypothetical protein
MVLVNAESSGENEIAAPEGGLRQSLRKAINPGTDTTRSNELTTVVLLVCPGGPFWLAIINTLIFCVLALLTPPVTTCFYPCIPPELVQFVPSMVAFGLSSFTSILQAVAQQQIDALAAASSAAARQRQQPGAEEAVAAPAAPAAAAERPPPEAAAGPASNAV